jgi:hypothetical protein
MQVKIHYEFSGIVWQHSASGGWFFVSLPIELAAEIRQHTKGYEEGWGRMKATAKVGATTWGTAIWFDTKLGTYLLPIKSEIRRKERIKTKSNISVQLSI